jgi:hypothetical protein
LISIALVGCGEPERRVVDLGGGDCTQDLDCLLVESGGDAVCDETRPCPSTQACVKTVYGPEDDIEGLKEARCVNLKPSDSDGNLLPCPEGTLEKNAEGGDGITINAIVCVGDTGTTCEDRTCFEAAAGS